MSVRSLEVGMRMRVVMMIARPVRMIVLVRMLGVPRRLAGAALAHVPLGLALLGPIGLRPGLLGSRAAHGPRGDHDGECEP